MIGAIPKKKHVRNSVPYSRLVGNKWEQASLDDPDLFDRLLSAAERAKLPLRDRLIVLMACKYGVCARGILRLTIGDWRVCEYRLEIRVHRQANRKKGIGVLPLGPDTASLLRAYIQGERKGYDPERRDILQLAGTDPLFLTEGGCAYGYQAFVSQWESLCQAAGISLPLHGLRHWFVIMRLRRIEERIHDPGDQQRCKAALSEYMGWQNPKTLRGYEMEYHREKSTREFDKFLAELFSANDPPAPRDPLLNYKKPQLVKRVHTLEQLVQELQHQLASAAETGIKREARIAELEASVAKLEPYRVYVEQLRAQMQREERGRFGDLPGV